MLRLLSLSQRIYALIGIFAIFFSAFGLLSFKILQEIKVGGPIFQRIGQSKDLVSDLLPPPLYIVESYLLCLQLERAGNAATAQNLMTRLRVLEGQYHERHQYWQQHLKGIGLAESLLVPLDNAASQFYQVLWQEFSPSLEKHDALSTQKALDKLNALYERHRHDVDRVVLEADAHSREEEVWAGNYIQAETGWLLAVLALSLLATISLAHLIQRSIARPLSKAVEVAHRVAAGDWRLPEIGPYRDEPGQLLSALSSMADSLQRSMEALANSEARSRHARELMDKLIETADIIVVGVDRHGLITLFNDAAERASGYKREQVLGQAWASINARLNPELSLDTIDTVERAAAQARTYDITTLSGERRRIIWRFSEPLQADILQGDDTDVVEISFGVDVTEQLKAERALRDAMAAAEAATQSRSAFLADMSHEVRTPMNAIIGMTGLALRTELPERARHHLHRVMAAAHALMRIINDVLDYSKIEAGKLAFEERPFVLSEALDTLVSQTVLDADEKGLHLHFDLAPELPLVLVGDPARLQQILLNLLSNALKFTTQGEIRIRIDSLERQGQQVLLRFEVRDTSLGLTPDQIASLFAAFVRVDQAPNRSPLSTGLGLAISRHLVEIMRGRVWVESEPGRGTRFIFTCWLGLHDVGAAGFAHRPRGQDLRLLIVDDNPSAREVLIGILGTMHPRLQQAGNGLEALAELERARAQGEPYHLVLMDWQMPGMDGLEALRRLRQWPGDGAALAVIMVTAHSRDDLLQAAKGLRIDAVLEKPVSPPSVLDALHQALNQVLMPSPQPAQSAPGLRLGGTSKRPLHPNLQGLHVLLAEDNEVNQELACALLTEAGVTVDVAVNGQQALEKLDRQRYDLVLMDWKMPLLDGLATTRRLRADPRHQDLPIVAMTSSAQPEDRAASLQAGMNDHLSKPIDPVQLLTIVARWARPGQPKP